MKMFHRFSRREILAAFSRFCYEVNGAHAPSKRGEIEISFLDFIE